MYTKKQRTHAFMICVVFLIVTLFSILFIVKEADHDCKGEDCPVCACIHQAEQTLKQLGTGIAPTTGIQPAVIPFILTLISVFLFVPCTSLISQKVRLNN